MSAPAAAFGPGAIAVSVAVVPEPSGEGRVAEVRVASTRPIGYASALFLNRPADEIPGLVGRLHSLCGLSHATAAAAAIAAARGEDWTAVAAARFDGLVAERLGEHLRSSFVGPTGVPAGEVSREALADLRAVLAATRETIAAVGGTVPRGDAADRVLAGCERLGLRLDRFGRPEWPEGTWAAETLRRAAAESGDRHFPADPLSAEDDAAVIAGLAADPTGFAAAPRLGERRPETGPFARAVAAVGGGGFDGRARLEARFGEIVRAALLLAGPAEARVREIGAWVGAATLDAHTGYAAVESPRGRLHHLVRLDAAGRVAAYAVAAPTEWNFGADGPFVATIRANRVTADEVGRARVERIAAAFDPCVGFAVTVEERTDA
jgi:hypothetical protein